MEKTISTFKTIIDFFLETIFPSKCIGCGIYGQDLCIECINKLEENEKQTEANIFALYNYQDSVVKDIIWKLKYHHTKRLGKKMGELLYEGLLEEIELIKAFSLGSPIYLIPVPISKDRKNLRGYNQSEIIAKSFCNKSPKNTFEVKNNIIFKKINTIPQAKLTNRSKRLKNIKGAFEIKNSQLVKGKTIIVIDDVTTTGGTLMEVMGVLRKNGAKKVIGFAVAH